MPLTDSIFPHLACSYRDKCTKRCLNKKGGGGENTPLAPSAGAAAPWPSTPLGSGASTAFSTSRTPSDPLPPLPGCCWIHAARTSCRLGGLKWLFHDVSCVYGEICFITKIVSIPSSCLQSTEEGWGVPGACLALADVLIAAMLCVCVCTYAHHALIQAKWGALGLVPTRETCSVHSR